ncbi:MAG: hypothetical protein FWF33_05340, partial [Clostridiales bacterium]|nr:hypothetical protein [Clostridiales bacterium]
GEMAKKTVINRALKRFIGSSDDSSLLMQSYDRTSDNEQLERGAADAEVIEDVAQSVDQILQEGEAAGAPRSPVSGESPEEDTEAGGEI